MASTIRKAQNPPKVKQACDCCHARKVKCNGNQPCDKCTALDLPCQFLLVPKKKGPKGPSGRIPKAVLKAGISVRGFYGEKISSVDRSAIKADPVIAGDIASRDGSWDQRPASRESIDAAPWSFDGISALQMSPLGEEWTTDVTEQFKPSPRVTLEIVQPHIQDLFTHKCTITPIIDPTSFQHLMQSFPTSPRVYALVASLCATSLSQFRKNDDTATSPESNGDNPQSSAFFVAEAKRARAFFDYASSPVLEDIYTSLFLYNAAHNDYLYALAFYHVREAITMLELLRLHREQTYSKMDHVLGEYSRRTFWVVFISERILALQQHQNLNLHANINLPSPLPDELPNNPSIIGFIDLVRLWRHIDSPFLNSWNNTPQIPTTPSPAEIMHYTSIQNSISTCLQENPSWSPAQRTDLLLTQQWLKIITWQLCISKGLISSSAEHESMNFMYPVKVAKETAEMGFRMEFLEPHGPGILEKVFDIGCCLVDVMHLSRTIPIPIPTDSIFNTSTASNPITSSNQSTTNTLKTDVATNQSLKEFLRLCSSARWGATRYLPLLEAKVVELGQDNSTPATDTIDTTRIHANTGHDRIYDDHSSSSLDLQGSVTMQHGSWQGDNWHTSNTNNFDHNSGPSRNTEDIHEAHDTHDTHQPHETHVPTNNDHDHDHEHVDNEHDDGFGLPLWDSRALEAMSENWMRSLTEPAYLDMDMEFMQSPL